MKINKKQILLIAGLVLLVLAIILLLTMCGGNQEEPQPSEPVQSEQSTESTSEPTDSTEETEETDPTEETEEEEEDGNNNTSGGNSRPGGTGGYTPGTGTGSGNDDDDSSTPQETTPAAGSDESPYMEVIPSFPDSVNSVSVSSKAAVNYQLALQDATVKTYKESLLIIEDPDAFVVYNEKKYEPKDGVVSVPLEASEDEAPVIVQIGSVSAEAKFFTLKLDAPVGTLENPETISWQEDGVYSLKPLLEAEDTNGYFYGFTAKRDGKLKLNIDSVKDAVACDIIVSNGEQTVTVAGDAEVPSLEVEFKKGAEVTVQIIAKADAEGKYPALEAELSGSVIYYGSKLSPLLVTEDFTTEEIAPGDVVYYRIENMAGRTVNVQEPAYIIYGDAVHKAPAEEVPEDPDASEGTEEDTGEEEPAVVSVKFGNTDNDAVFAVGVDGEESKRVAVTFGYPVGNINNKAPLLIANVDEETEGINTAVIGEGDADVYWFTWTNTVDEGILTLQLPKEGNWKYAITHTSGENKTEYELQASDMPDVQKTVNLLLKYEDVVDIFVTTYDPEAEESAPAPAGSVEIQASFLAHIITNAVGETLVTLDGNGLQYCKQGLKYADGATMTVIAVETDEEGNVKLDEDGNAIVLTDRVYTIDYEGTIYDSAEGRIVIEDIEMESADPDVFSILNRTEDTVTYQITFTYPPGSQANPIPLELGSYTVELYGDGGSGTYYSWIATQPGTFRMDIDPEDIWSYNISSTKDSGVFSSTQNGASTDFVPYVELIISQSHLDASKDGTVTVFINLGNPSTDAANLSVIDFTIGTYKTKVTADTSVKVAAGQTYPLLQMLADADADGMIVTGEGDFTVAYAGQSYLSENGTVEVENFSKDNTYFQIINNSDADGSYGITFTYPLRSQKNPEIMEAGKQAIVNLADIAVDQYQYFTWTAPADGEFRYELIGNTTLKYKPWKYEITHGENVYAAQGVSYTAVMAQTFAVKAGDTVNIKVGILRADTTQIPTLITFTEAEPVALEEPQITEVEFTGTHEPQPFQLAPGEAEKLIYADLTATPDLYLAPEQGLYYHYDSSAPMYVDLSNDTFVNLKKLLETDSLYWDQTEEDGSITRETYNTLLQKYVDCAHVIVVSQTEEQTVEKTLYPMTEDLVYILIRLGNQLGWYDSEAEGYLFGEITDAEADYVWMFPCCWAQTEEIQTADDQAAADAKASAAEGETVPNNQTGVSEQDTEQTTGAGSNETTPKPPAPNNPEEAEKSAEKTEP